MDSITQAALGATVAGAIAGRRCNGKVLLAGAALGTLPDLDVLIDYGNDISNVVQHRGFSHSLLVLFPFSFVLSWLIHTFRPIKNWSFPRLWFLIGAGLMTHPLLDYFTSYGTQLLWPLVGYYSHSSVFIIDPLYTLPLIVAVVMTMRRREKAYKYCINALILSSIYLGWTDVASRIIEQRAIDSLAVQGLPTQQIFISPTPFNSVLWRVVVLDGEHYWEGTASLLDEKSSMRFIKLERGKWPFESSSEQLNALKFFTKDFVRYYQVDDKFVVADLRLGAFGRTAFEFQFAEQKQGEWQLIEPSRVSTMPLDGDLGKMWQRLKGDQRIDARLGDCQACTGSP